VIFLLRFRNFVLCNYQCTLIVLVYTYNDIYTYILKFSENEKESFNAIQCGQERTKNRFDMQNRRRNFPYRIAICKTLKDESHKIVSTREGRLGFSEPPNSRLRAALFWRA